MDEVEVGLPEQSGSGNEVVPIEPGKEDAQKTQQSDSAKESSLQLKEGWYWFMEDHPAEEERVSETESSPDKEEEK
jgi:hypothetical protein